MQCEGFFCSVTFFVIVTLLYFGKFSINFNLAFAKARLHIPLNKIHQTNVSSSATRERFDHYQYSWI